MELLNGLTEWNYSMELLNGAIELGYPVAAADARNALLSYRRKPASIPVAAVHGN